MLAVTSQLEAETNGYISDLNTDGLLPGPP